MNIGKTNYTISFNGNSEIIDKIVKEWLSVNKFELTNKNNEEFYYYHDAWQGNRGFQYNINGNNLNLYAWTIGLGNKYYMLDSGALNNMAGDTYKSLLESLFNQIKQYSNQSDNIVNNQINNIQQSTQQYTNNQDVSTFTNTFKEENNKQKEKLCNIGFWLSILGLLFSFAGITYSVIIYIMNFYFASQGLQTKKRGRAIATIIISIISIFIILLYLI